MVTIAERPARSTTGQFRPLEGDSSVVAQSFGGGTLVERQTRFVMLLHLPDTHEATAVQAA